MSRRVLLGVGTHDKVMKLAQGFASPCQLTLAWLAASLVAAILLRKDRYLAR